MSDGMRRFEVLRIPEVVRERAVVYMDAENGSFLKAARHREKSAFPLVIFFGVMALLALAGTVLLADNQFEFYWGLAALLVVLFLGAKPFVEWGNEKTALHRVPKDAVRMRHEEAIIRGDKYFVAFILHQDITFFNSLLEIWRRYLIERDSHGVSATRNPKEREVVRALQVLHTEIVSLNQYYHRMYVDLEVEVGQEEPCSFELGALPASRVRLFWARRNQYERIRHLVRFAQDNTVRFTACDLDRILSHLAARDRMYSDRFLEGTEEEISIPPVFDDVIDDDFDEGGYAEEIVTVFLDDPEEMDRIEDMVAHDAAAVERLDRERED